MVRDLIPLQNFVAWLWWGEDGGGWNNRLRSERPLLLP